MESIVSLLLLAGLGIVVILVIVAAIALGKKGNVRGDASSRDRGESYARGASGNDTGNGPAK